MPAAIEIYNKPQIAYRDECFVILILNAWELRAFAGWQITHAGVPMPPTRSKGARPRRPSRERVSP